MSKVRALRERQARRHRVSHPTDARLVPNLSGAPKAVIDAQKKAEALLTRRIEIAEAARAAQQTARAAPAHDRAAKRAAFVEDKEIPKPTEPTARAEVDELRERLRVAKEVEAEAFERLAEVIAEHADGWVAARAKTVTAKSEAAAKALREALDAWNDLDREHSLSTWIHTLDPDDRSTYPLTRVEALSIGDQEGDRILEGLIALVQQATERVTADRPGREQWAAAKAERQAKRAQRAKRRQKVAA